MTGICGWASAGQRSYDALAMTARLSGNAASAAQTISGPGTSISLSSQPIPTVLWQDEELCLAVNGYPRWSDKAAASMSAADFAERFVTAYRERGIKALSNIHGHFAVVLTRKDGKEALLATDRIGSQPLKFSLDDDTLVFGSSADAINAALPTAPQIDHQALFNYVYFEMVPAPGTAFRNIQRLLPGQYLQYRDGHVSRGIYWTPDYLDKQHGSYKELETELLELLERSIGATVSGKTPGAFLSGGIDSSTVTGMLGRVTHVPARTYSIGFDAEGYDEIAYARIAARHFGTDHHEYYVTPRDVANAVPLVATAYDAPFGNASAVPSLYCARLAKEDGVDQLLGGDGGDELFGGNSRYAKQWVFSLYDSVPHLIRRGLIEPAVASSLAKYFVPRKLNSYVKQASIPMPERMQTYNLLTRIGPQRIFTEDFLASVDLTQPLGMITETYHNAKADNFTERMLAVDMRFTLADNDLPKVCGMCDLAGVGVSFPFLDDRLISFSQCLPADLKVKRTNLRYFFKNAIKNFLPPEIITKKKHGFGLPFGLWLRNDPGLQVLVGDTLESLKQRNIIQPRFLDDLTSERLDEHAAYYGTMAWTLMILELWLQSRTA